MPLITHTFKVGDGNFIVSHSNGVMVINDAGYGKGHPRGIFDTQDKAASQDTPLPGITAFRNILKNNNIHIVHTVISHQDKDHYKLLEPLFQQVAEEQQTRDNAHPLNIGRFVIGGDRFINQRATNLHNNLIKIANEVGPIKAEFVGHGNMYSTVKTYNYNSDGNFDQSASEEQILEPKRDNNKDAIKTFRRIYFQNPNDQNAKQDRSKYLKLFYPKNMEEIKPKQGRACGPDKRGPEGEPTNSNRTNLMNMLVAKKVKNGIKIVQKGLITGDAEPNVKYQQFTTPVKGLAKMVPPHHLGNVKEQAKKVVDQDVGAGNWENILIVGSTSRPDEKLHPNFQGGNPLHPNMFFTRDIRDGEVITTIMKSGKNVGTNVKVELLHNLTNYVPKVRNTFLPNNSTRNAGGFPTQGMMRPKPCSLNGWGDHHPFGLCNPYPPNGWGNHHPLNNWGAVQQLTNNSTRNREGFSTQAMMRHSTNTRPQTKLEKIMAEWEEELEEEWEEELRIDKKAASTGKSVEQIKKEEYEESQEKVKAYLAKKQLDEW